MRAKKSLGQHFLVDKSVIKKLISCANISKDDVILEIGAGTGNLTLEIAKTGAKVIAVEVDKDLIQKLYKKVGSFKNVEIKNLDILNFLDTKEFKRKCQAYKAVGSIPYQITSPLIHKIVFIKNPLCGIYFLVQLELAKKICATPPNASYLSNFVRYFGDPKIIEKVKRGAFKPPPKVDSAILAIENINTKGKNLKEWSQFLHKGFSHPRKMLRSVIDENLLKKCAINPNMRAQELTINKWEKLFKLHQNNYVYRTS